MAAPEQTQPPPTRLSSDPDTPEDTTGWTIRLPPDPSPAEAAAIASAIAIHLTDQAEPEEPPETWAGERWRYAGRLASVTGRPTRVPTTAPTDPWTAAGRAHRF